ncbi:MAG TPA: ferritin-like domain-containing protein [Polyangiaceae bacterium]
MQSKAAEIWAFRARAEHQAAARFARLSTRLSEVGADKAVIGMARRAASDEERHRELCVDLVRHFGAEPKTDSVRAPPEVAPSGLAVRERVLYEVVALSCVTETLSAALLGAMVDKAEDVWVKATVHRILRDEIDHGRLGWAHLSLEFARGYGRFLGDYLPAMLEGTVDDELFRDDEDDETLAGLGALCRMDRRTLFTGTMREIVFPGLERFGVDTSAGAQWLGEKLQSSLESRHSSSPPLVRQI